MEWTPNLSVGIEEIDNQHKELIKRINDLVLAIKQHVCKYKIPDVMQFLEEYVVMHFGEEEKRMLKTDYPGYAAHRAQHEQFMRNLFRIKAEVEKLEGGKKPGSYDLSVETNQIIVDWIFEHIAKVDKKLGEFLQSKS